MTETTPFARMLEMQRRSIERTRDAVHWSVETSKQSNRVALNRVESTRSVQAKGSDVGRTSVASAIAGLNAMLPGGRVFSSEVEDAMDEQFKAADDINEEVWEAVHSMVEENATAFEELTELYLDFVDTTTEQSLSVLSQFEADAESIAISE